MDEQRPQLSEQMQNSSGSFELVLSAVLLGVGGFFVDGWVGTRPVFMVLFTVLGFLGAAASVYYRYTHEIARLNEETAALRQASIKQTTKRTAQATTTQATPGKGVRS